MRAVTILICLAACAFTAPARADELTPEKQADIRLLIGATGREQLAAQLADAASRTVAATLKRTRPDIPERAYKRINAALLTLFEDRLDTPGGLVERLVTIYHQHLTHEEVKELLAFYRTPLGRKTIEVLPGIVSDSMAAGQAWGQSLAPEIRQRVDAALKAEGVEPRKK